MNRIQSLDAFRGLAILMMVLSGIIPFGTLPAWMYHAQLPPPDHLFNPGIPGITWVDLVFPMFLFAMGAAFPLALNRRIDRGGSVPSVVLVILKRGFLLGVFALFLQHVRPFQLNAAPETGDWLLALAGFLTLFLIFLRYPDHWNRSVRVAGPVAGWIGAVLLLGILTYPDGSGASLYRSDIILVVLTNMAVFGALLWLFTRNRPLIRLAVLAILAGCILSAGADGWVKAVWSWSPVPWIFKFAYLKYLFLVIPGTFAGEIIQQHTAKRAERPASPWDTSKKHYLALIFLVFSAAVVAGLFSRDVALTVAVTTFTLIFLQLMMRDGAGTRDGIYLHLFHWAAFLLVLGLVLEPFEGGIRKDHSTFSYYFVTGGISVFLLMPLHIWLDDLGKTRWFPFLTENGQNPMMAYAAMMNLIVPVLVITGADAAIKTLTAAPWTGALRGLVYTLLLAWLVALISRRNLFWKT